MEIQKITISGESPLNYKIAQLFSKFEINHSTSTANFRDSDLIIESLSGNIEQKKQLLESVQKNSGNDVILASNSSCNVTEIASSIRKRHNFLGLHFTLNPFQEKFVVQKVKCLETSHSTLETIRKLLKQTNATVIEGEDSPGLVLDRPMAVMINEAITMYSTKLATINDIDRTTKLCLNWPAGPFELADTLGLDNVLYILENMASQIGPQFTPSCLLRQMVAIGRLGRKTGKGFYSYTQEEM
jgi:3-hydroxybutyryl-CoA dehydrogenase